MSSVQKALIVAEIGKPVKLIHDKPIPEPGPKQIQLKVKIAGINPTTRRPETMVSS